ncbi:hypothetical protein Tco_1060845, partial [Tanacetum coccineum]
QFKNKVNLDRFYLMGLTEKQRINLVKKDKETVINCDTDKEMEKPIPAEFNKDQGGRGTKCNSTMGSMESTCSMRFKFSEADFVRVSELGDIIRLEMPSSFNEVNRLLHRMSEINVNR